METIVNMYAISFNVNGMLPSNALIYVFISTRKDVYSKNALFVICKLVNSINTYPDYFKYTDHFRFQCNIKLNKYVAYF